MNIDQSKPVQPRKLVLKVATLRLSIIRTRASVVALTAAFALVSLAPGASMASAATTSQSGPVAHTTIGSTPSGGAEVNSIIMRDGGICDPIRHMGC
jgi:hypothetical protein